MLLLLTVTSNCVQTERLVTGHRVNYPLNIVTVTQEGSVVMDIGHNVVVARPYTCLLFSQFAGEALFT